MPYKRKDTKGRSLRNGESQLPDGRYKFQYTDNDGCRRAVYSWKLVETDRLKADQRQQEQFIDFVYSSPVYGRLGNLFTVLLGTGLRIGEALALTWDDVDFNSGLITVHKTWPTSLARTGSTTTALPRQRPRL